LSITSININRSCTANVNGDGKVSSRHRSRVPARGRGRIRNLSLDDRIDSDGEFSGRCSSAEATSIHTAGDSQTKVRFDEDTVGGRRDSLLRAETVFFDFTFVSLVTLWRSFDTRGQLDGSFLSLFLDKGFSWLDTTEIFSDDTKVEMFTMVLGTKLDVLDKFESDISDRNLTLGVIDFSDDTSLFPRSIGVLFESSPHGDSTLTAATARSDFLVNWDFLGGDLVLEGLSDGESLLMLDLGIDVFFGFQVGFNIVSNFSNSGATSQEERAGKTSRDLEWDGEGELARRNNSSSMPVVDVDNMLNASVFGFSRDIDVVVFNSSVFIVTLSLLFIDPLGEFFTLNL
jgi:hypothetical protein